MKIQFTSNLATNFHFILFIHKISAFIHRWKSFKKVQFLFKFVSSCHHTPNKTTIIHSKRSNIIVYAISTLTQRATRKENVFTTSGKLSVQFFKLWFSWKKEMLELFHFMFNFELYDMLSIFNSQIALMTCFWS